MLRGPVAESISPAVVPSRQAADEGNAAVLQNPGVGAAVAAEPMVNNEPMSPMTSRPLSPRQRSWFQRPTSPEPSDNSSTPNTPQPSTAYLKTPAFLKYPLFPSTPPSRPPEQPSQPPENPERELETLERRKSYGWPFASGSGSPGPNRFTGKPILPAATFLSLQTSTFQQQQPPSSPPAPSSPTFPNSPSAFTSLDAKADGSVVRNPRYSFGWFSKAAGETGLSANAAAQHDALASQSPIQNASATPDAIEDAKIFPEPTGEKTLQKNSLSSDETAISPAAPPERSWLFSRMQRTRQPAQPAPLSYSASSPALLAVATTEEDEMPPPVPPKDDIPKTPKRKGKEKEIESPNKSLSFNSMSETDVDHGATMTANSMMQIIAAEIQRTTEEALDREDIIAADLASINGSVFDERSSIHDVVMHGPRFLRGSNSSNEKPRPASGVPLPSYLDAGAFGLLPSASSPPTSPAPWPQGKDLSGALDVIEWEEDEGGMVKSNDADDKGEVTLSVEEKIKIAFELPAVEEYRGEFACWLVRSVLLKGYMYLTEKHICFFASLPVPEAGIIQKSGFLGKRPRGTRLQYVTYWFSLKNDVLYYFENSTNLYFPTGGINLKYATAVEPSKTKENGFKIVTPRKKYHLMADTEVSKREWIAALKASIFRARNEGSDVRIVLPLASITQISHNKTTAFMDTIQVQIVDNELLVNEEYFFSYFNDVSKAYTVIKELWEKHRVLDPAPETFRQKLNDAPDTPSRYRRRRSMVEAPSSSNTDDTDAVKKRMSMSNLDEAVVDSSVSPRAIKFTSSFLASSPTKKVQISSAAMKDDPMLVRSPSSPFMKNGERGSPTKPRTIQHRRSESDYLLKLKGPATVEPLTTSPTLEAGVTNLAEDLKGEEGDLATIDGEKNNASRWGWRAGHRKSFSDASVMESFANTQRSDLFREQFAMPVSENLLSAFTCYLVRVLPRLGKIYVSDNYVCFQSKVVGIRTKVIIPISDILSVQRDKQREYFYHGLFLLTRDQSEIYFEFYSSEQRNKCLELISSLLSASIDGVKDLSPDRRPINAKRHLAVLDDVHQSDYHFKIELTQVEMASMPPINGSLKKVRPPPMHITCLTIGTRGDVQPYIALCKRLMKHGHQCRIATHLEYQGWIESHGIEFREVKGNPAELMQCCVDNGMFTVSFIRDASSKFRGWIDELLTSSWEACQGTQLLIESPTAMAGIHIAEKLGGLLGISKFECNLNTLDIPFFGAFSMPWTRTRAFPHPFAVTERHLGGGYNYMSYIMMDQILWKGTSYQVNRWRKNTLDRPPIVLGNLGEHKIPYLYFFSPSVVPPPSDWHDWIHMTGYWFLDDPDVGWVPPKSLTDFINDGPPPVYIGFGSIIVPDPDALTRTIVAAVQKAGVRAVVSKGWSARLKEKKNGDVAPTEEVEFPDFIYQIDKVPHDWLFPLMAGVVHHGGCGTTGAGIRAGVPTAIRPYFGDQFFWADRVQELGVGCAIRKLTVDKLAAALTSLVSDEKMREKAKLLGARVRSEDGIGSAIDCIYRDLEFARSRVRKLAQMTSPVLPTNISTTTPPTEAGVTAMVEEDTAQPIATPLSSSPQKSSGFSLPSFRPFTRFKPDPGQSPGTTTAIATAHPEALT
ncbi:Sterol 3-beta-glucosyltransferase [Phlyctochytrium planicorne]|nr:Sterol 3-beta-glucosyltransferase [Phlyctochytrium planicorne]